MGKKNSLLCPKLETWRKKSIRSIAVGEKVFGQWADKKYYPAVVKDIQQAALWFYEFIILWIRNMISK